MATIFCWHAFEFSLFRIRGAFVFVRVVFGLDDDSPASRKNAAVDVEFIGLEEVAAKDGDDCQVLAIWEMYDIGPGTWTGTGCHVERKAMYSQCTKYCTVGQSWSWP